MKTTLELETKVLQFGNEVFFTLIIIRNENKIEKQWIYGNYEDPNIAITKPRLSEPTTDVLDCYYQLFLEKENRITF